MSLKLALLSLGLMASTNAIPHKKHTPGDNCSIKWSPCSAEFLESVKAPNGTQMDCSTLAVPLDYTTKDTGKLNLNLFRTPATKEPVLGTVIFNPGGPGGTGGENLPIQGPILVEQFGGQYHVVSWDPRGTGKTLPFACNISGATGNQKRNEEGDHLIKVNSTEAFLNAGYDQAVAYAEACYESNKGVGEYIGTTFAARDVMQIVDALGDGGMLRYYGLSYGTALGDYIAAMFPDRIERMILDSNMNPHDYQDGSYRTYPIDLDKTLNKFFEECIKNADRCSLAAFTKANTTEELIDIINAALAPLAPNATQSAQGWQLFALSKMQFQQGLYFPRLWSDLADTITEALNGSAAEAAQQQSNETTPTEPQQSYNLGTDSINGIRCGDSLTRISSPEEYLDTITIQNATSPGFGDVGYIHTWFCAAWKFMAKEQYKGNFQAKTKNPILFINGRYDPATAFRGAINVSAGFEGSVLLTHGGFGHGVMGHPSNCTNDYIKGYLMEGTLPEKDTVCEPNTPNPWDLVEVFSAY